jgi:lipoate-protein ligase A
MDADRWRLVFSPALPGAINMALDEALLEFVSTRRQPPTLRFYRWEPTCLSLGYAQPADQADPACLEAMGWDIVRRPTGGRAILHTDELTYSIAAPVDHPLVAGGVLGSYRLLSQGLLAGLAALGVTADTAPEQALSEPDRSNPVCFEMPSAHEVTAGGRKLIGSAQLRRVSGVLQHGSLPLMGDLGRICLGLAYAHDADRQAAAARVRRRAATLAELLGRPVSWDHAAEAMADGFRRALGLRLVEGAPSEDEDARAAALRLQRYASAEWTQRGRPRGGELIRPTSG